MAVLDEFAAYDTRLVFKFGNTLQFSSVTADKFYLYLAGATLTAVPDAFRDISLDEDYNPVSRILNVYFAVDLLPETDYIVQLRELNDAAGHELPAAQVHFTTSTTAGAPAPPAVPEIEAVEVEDHSIRSPGLMTSETILAVNPDFYIVSTDPEAFELMVEPDRNAGRINIEFSQRPSAEFINSTYFKAQRKLIQRAPVRWVDIPVQISLGVGNIVYVDFPSNDATPVYGVADKTYFESGFKYRIKISKLVGI